MSSETHRKNLHNSFAWRVRKIMHDRNPIVCGPESTIEALRAIGVDIRTPQQRMAYDRMMNRRTLRPTGWPHLC